MGDAGVKGRGATRDDEAQIALLPGVGTVVAIAGLGPDEGGMVPERRRHGDRSWARQFSDENVWTVLELSRIFRQVV